MNNNIMNNLTIPCFICNAYSIFITNIPFWLILFVTSDVFSSLFWLCLHFGSHAFLKFYRPHKICFLLDDMTFIVFSTSVFLPILLLDFHLISFILAFINILAYISIVIRHGCS